MEEGGGGIQQTQTCVSLHEAYSADVGLIFRV